MKFGTAFLVVGALLILLGGFVGLTFLVPHGTGSAFSNLLGLVVLGVLPVGAGLALVTSGLRRTRLEREGAERAFAELVENLARRKGGEVPLEDVAAEARLTREEAQMKMLALAGQGRFELASDSVGRPLYKLPASGSPQLSQASKTP